MNTLHAVDIPKTPPKERGDALLAQAVTAYSLHAEDMNDIETRYIIELCRAIISRNAAGATAAARTWMFHRYNQEGCL